MNILSALLACSMGAALVGCSNTTAVRTSDEKFAKTNWHDVQVLTAVPTRDYIEVGSLNTSGWGQKKTEEMYKEFRQEAAKMGGEAVLITESGVEGRKDDQWARAAAIRFVEGGE